ncbi:hypothetical protein J2S20_002319 [Moryella indoligenes]|uniref:Uncharacterized protein n=1 Tax=Moryella indoligenes TaxID=371674 RepID=A0AAE3VC69_9FIRM|nr:hypothetical protein [Moryella indoligenes]MDQ0153598.1 hypothetical protein [Moryella indoligenes]
MSDKFKIKLNTAGVGELLKSVDMQDALSTLAQGYAARLGAKYKAEPVYIGKTRPNVQIGQVIFSMDDGEKKHNHLLKGLQHD